MKLDYLIDTNILILLLNDSLAESIPDGQLGCSIITNIELLSFSGLTADEETIIRDCLQSLNHIFLSAAIVEKTVFLRRKYRLKTPDAIVVATAWDASAVLLSNDRQLSQVSEIQLVSLATKTS